MEVIIRKRVVLFIATLSSFLTPFMGSAITVALPSIGREFAVNAVSLGWVNTAYLLAAAMFLVPFGRIADIYGRKKIFTCGMVVFALSLFLSANSTSLPLLVSFQALQGIGGAMIYGTSVAILTSAFPIGERGKVLGINAAATYSGISLGPVLGGVLTERFSWRSIFLAGLFLSLMIIAIVFGKLKGEWAGARGERFDLVGSVIYSISLAAVIYGFSLLPSTFGMLLIFAGGLGLLAFFILETQMKNPVLNVHLFLNNRVFAFSNLAALINYSATFAVSFLLSLYLQYVKGLSPQSAGLVLLAQPVVQAVMSPFSGRLSDRVEPRIVASAGMTLTFAGLLLFAFLNEGTALSLIVANLSLLGLGFALFSSPNTNAVMSSVEKRFYGVASGTLGTMRLIGQTLSMAVAMLVLTLYLGGVQITPEQYPLFLEGARTVFRVFSALCFLGVFASLVRGRLR
ncbi:MFS transporter [Candidatus Bathyarchaeota archaeon]|nr:MFS transporter [Candidatus Bathyarchaeota archaeon]